MKAPLTVRFLLFLAGLAMLLAACDLTPPVAPPTPEETGAPAATRLSQQTPTAQPQPSATPAATPTSQIRVRPENLRSVSLQLWSPWSLETGDALQSLVQTFNQENEWGVQVQAVFLGSYDELNTQMEQALQTQSLPDLVIAYPYQALSWDKTQPLVDLEPYVKDPIWGYSSQEQKDFYPIFWQQGVFEGKRWGLPAPASGQFLYYNLSWARELGFEQAPQTPDQFQQQACAASRANRQDNSPDNDGTGGWIVSTQYAGMGGWLSAFGARVSEPGSSQYHFDTQPVQKAFTFLRGLYDQGCAWLAEGEPPEGEFASRLGLFSTGSMLGIPYQKQAFQQANNPDQWTVIPFPSPSGKAAIEVYGSYYVALPSTPEKQLAAWLLLKWLEAPENQAALIQAGGGFPASASAAQALKSYGTAHPQWAAALDLLPQANPEPARPSWATVRWALSDASTQLFRSYFTVQQVPDLTKLLDKTAADLESEK